MTIPEKLFGYGCQKVNLTAMAPIVGVSKQTLSRWRNGEYEKMPIWALRMIVNIRSLSDEDIVKIVKGKKL